MIAIEVALRDTISWYIEQDKAGELKFYPVYYNTQGRLNEPYTQDAFFGATHPKLRAWITNANTMERTKPLTVTTQCLNSMQRYWEVDSLLIDSGAYALAGAETHPYLGIARVGALAVIGAGMYLSATRMFAVQKTPEGEPYATDDFTDSVFLKASWLDAHYPQWRDLHAVGEVLGLDGDGLKQIIFGLGPYARTIVSGVTVTTKSFGDLDLLEGQG